MFPEKATQSLSNIISILGIRNSFKLFFLQGLVDPCRLQAYGWRTPGLQRAAPRGTAGSVAMGRRSVGICVSSAPQDCAAPARLSTRFIFSKIIKLMIFKDPSAETA